MAASRSRDTMLFTKLPGYTAHVNLHIQLLHDRIYVNAVRGVNCWHAQHVDHGTDLSNPHNQAVPLCGGILCQMFHALLRFCFMISHMDSTWQLQDVKSGENSISALQITMGSFLHELRPIHAGYTIVMPYVLNSTHAAFYFMSTYSPDGVKCVWQTCQHAPCKICMVACIFMHHGLGATE